MLGRNCAFFGCPSSQKHKLSLFQIPVPSAKQSEHTAALKRKSREEWLAQDYFENKGDDPRTESANRKQQHLRL